MGGGYPDPQGKQPASAVGYTQGEYPHVCGTCSSYSGETLLCDKVQGPYEDGTVAPNDTCHLWEPNFAALGIQPKAGAP